MIPAPIPSVEPERLAAVTALDLLDTPPEERFDRITRIARRLFDVPVVLVTLVDAERQWFKSCIGLDVAETPRDISFCGHAILEHRPLVVENALNDPRFADNPLVVGEPGLRFYAGYPLAGPEGQLVGTLCVIDFEPRRFDDDDRASLRDLAGVVESELSVVRLATTDDLTGIANRRGFSASAEQALGIAQRDGRPASLVYVDLDDFKQINDRYGHAEGDRALVIFSELLTETFRKTDVVARMGGDEFAVLLSDSDRAAAEAVVARLRCALDARCSDAALAYDIEHSVGVVEFDAGRHASLHDLMADADRQMYRDKRGAGYDESQARSLASSAG